MTFFDGKVALVTGGASGIGLAIVQNLLKTGIKGVTVVDISEEDLKRTKKNLYLEHLKKILFVNADVTNQQELKGAFDKTINTFKNLDIVVNNAGIVNEIQWDKTLAVNLEAVIRGTYLAKDTYFPTYKCGDEGIIVNTASILGLGALSYIPVYCATKHGVVGLGKALGAQKGGFRLITICPGLVNTSLVGKMVTKESPPNWGKSVDREVPLSPEFLGETVVNLIQDGKHGSIWIIDNGEPPYEAKFSDPFMKIY